MLLIKMFNFIINLLYLPERAFKYDLLLKGNIANEIRSDYNKKSQI